MTFGEFACHVDLRPISQDGKTVIAIYVRSESDNIMALKPHIYSDLISAICDYGNRELDWSNSMIVYPAGVAFWLQ